MPLPVTPSPVPEKCAYMLGRGEGPPRAANEWEGEALLAAGGEKLRSIFDRLTFSRAAAAAARGRAVVLTLGFPDLRQSSKGKMRNYL